MPDKHDKLPYVFVEIDEPEEPEVIKPYIYDDPPYPQYGASPYPGPYQSPMPQGFAGAPYPGPTPSPYPPHGMSAQSYGDPASYQAPDTFEDDSRDFDHPLYSRDQVEDYDLDNDLDDEALEEDDYFVKSVDEHAFDKESDSVDGLEGDAAIDDDLDDFDFDSFDEPESDELDLKTVVVPVFKNMGLPRAKKGDPQPVQQAQPMTNQAPSQIPPQIIQPRPQMPMGQMAPVYQALPYAYNPYRVPFVSPAWMQPFMPIPVMPPVRGPQFPVSPTPQRQAPVQRGGEAGPALQQGIANSHASTGVRGSSKLRDSLPSIKSEPKPSGQSAISMPAEAREALSSLDRPAAPIDERRLSRMRDRSASTNASKSPSQGPKAKNTIVIDPTGGASSGQTITANTDSVSVSVKVMPPKAAQGASGAAPAAKNQPPTALSASSIPSPLNEAVPASMSNQASIPAAGSTEPKVNGQSAKKRPSEPKHPKETFEEKAMRENAEKTHTSLVESAAVDEMGKPLLDANAIETSDMFSAPATSMNESMKGFFKSSRRKRTLVIVLLALIVAIVVAVIVCLVAVWSGAAVITYDANNVPSIALTGNTVA